MKRKGIVLLFILMLSMSACSKKTEHGFQDINSSDVMSKISNKETFLLLIVHEDSYACDTFIEEIKPTVQDNNLVLQVLDGTDMDESIKDQLNIALGDYSSWPSLFYVKDGTITITDKYEYSLEPEGWKSWMTNMKLIKKEN